MSSRQHVDEQIAADLYQAYRSSLDDTPYGATDQAVLQAAALGVTGARSHARACTALAVLLATLGLVLSLTLLPSRMQQITQLSFSHVDGRANVSGSSHPTGRDNAPQVQQANGDRGPITPYGEYSAGAMLGPAFTQESQLEQATVAMQLTAESQYAVLAMQAAATQSDLHDVTLELLRIQPVLSSAR